MGVYTPGSPALRIAEWVNANLRPPTPREPRATHLYVYGNTLVGKSRLVYQLAEFFLAYDMPMFEDYYDEFQDNHFDFVIADDVRAQKKISFWLRWLQGYSMSVKVKGGQVRKNGNLPTILTSNFDIETNYAKSPASKLAPLLARLEQVYVAAGDLDVLFMHFESIKNNTH